MGREFDGQDPWTVWHNESEYINHRLTWLGIVSPLVFGAFVWARPEYPDLSNLVAWFGLIATFVTFAGVLAAIGVQIWLRLSGRIDRLGPTVITSLIGWMPAVVIPALILYGWWMLVFGDLVPLKAAADSAMIPAQAPISRVDVYPPFAHQWWVGTHPTN